MHINLAWLVTCNIASTWITPPDVIPLLRTQITTDSPINSNTTTIFHVSTVSISYFSLSGLWVQSLVIPAGVLCVVCSGYRPVSGHVSGGGVDGSAGGQRTSLQPPAHHRPRTHEVCVWKHFHYSTQKTFSLVLFTFYPQVIWDDSSGEHSEQVLNRHQHNWSGRDITL